MHFVILFNHELACLSRFIWYEFVSGQGESLDSQSWLTKICQRNFIHILAQPHAPMFGSSLDWKKIKEGPRMKQNLDITKAICKVCCRGGSGTRFLSKTGYWRSIDIPNRTVAYRNKISIHTVWEELNRFVLNKIIIFRRKPRRISL